MLGILMPAGIYAINLHWLRLCKFMFFAYLVFLLTILDNGSFFLIYCSCLEGVYSLYHVFEVFPDGFVLLRFSSVDRFDSILYVYKHMYDHLYSRLAIL